jgi:hypothetical protein
MSNLKFKLLKICYFMPDQKLEIHKNWMETKEFLWIVFFFNLIIWRDEILSLDCGTKLMLKVPKTEGLSE